MGTLQPCHMDEFCSILLKDQQKCKELKEISKIARTFKNMYVVMFSRQFTAVK